MHRQRQRKDNREKREDIAFIIPAFSMILLIPPLVNLFMSRTMIFGVPLEIVYLFTIWLLLVLGAVGLSFWLPATGQISSPDRRNFSQTANSETESCSRRISSS